MKFNNKPYGNYKMVSITGDFLAYTDLKRMNWYLDRDLAEQLNSHDYKLKFVTKGNGNGKRCSFYKLPLKNECVVCGKKEDLTKHHVIPSQYRKYLPEKYKSRASYDVVSICNSCHNDYERVADILKSELLIKYGLENYEKRNRTIKSYHNTLKLYSDFITKEKFELMTNFLEMELDNSISNILKIERFDFEHLGAVFMRNIEDIEGFIIMWREHFIKTTNPKFIAKEWIDGIKTNFAI